MTTMTTMTRLSFALVALAVVSLGACNTFKGAGRDVSAAGRSIENAATDVQDDLEKDDLPKEDK